MGPGCLLRRLVGARRGARPHCRAPAGGVRLTVGASCTTSARGTARVSSATRPSSWMGTVGALAGRRARLSRVALLHDAVFRQRLADFGDYPSVAEYQHAVTHMGQIF